MNTFHYRSSRPIPWPSTVALPEVVRGYRRCHRHDESANPRYGELLGVVRSEITSDQATCGHDARLSPKDDASKNEHDDCDAIHNAIEHDFQGVHGVDVGHTEGREHRGR